jgi:hypothetical protein
LKVSFLASVEPVRAEFVLGVVDTVPGNRQTTKSLSIEDLTYMTSTALVSDIQPILNTYNRNAKGVRGRNTRQWKTCDNCPEALKASCTKVCHEMEMYMASNCNTIRHNSPLADGGDTENLVWPQVWEIDGKFRGSPTVQAIAGYTLKDPGPEVQLIEKERNEKAQEILLHYIGCFASQATKKFREKAIIESILTLHFIEDYKVSRVAEILGQRWEEFRGYSEFHYKATHGARKEGQRLIRPKGHNRVLRTIDRFEVFIRKTHFAERIKEVMQTGNMAAIIQPVV